MTFYKKEQGSFLLLNKEVNRLDNAHDILFMSNEVSILLDTRLGIFLKHGKPELVSAYMKKCKNQGLDTSDFRIFTSSRWKCDELNKILENTGYANRLLDPVKSQHFFE
jgi:hypothetical protein